jgi:tetratricopeptide (TPR) repeat protein
VRVVAADDWASVGSAAMVLGIVRARQGRSQEAESLLRKAIAVTESTDYVAERWEYYLSLAEFLLSTGRSTEAEPWVAKLREIIALYGEASPIAAYVERRLATTVPSPK